MKIAGLGEKRIEELKESGIQTATDLLNNFPSKYIDFSNISAFNPKLTVMQSIRCKATGDAQNLFFKKLSSVKVPMQDILSGNNFLAVWYNQPYITKTVKNGNEYLLYGKMSPSKFGEFIVQSIKPFSEEILKPLGVYKPIGSVKSANFKTAVQDILQKINIESVLPDHIERFYDLESLKMAYSKIHFPNTLADVEAAKKRICLEEYLKLLAIKEQIDGKHRKNTKYADYLPFLPLFEECLGFSLTADQRNAIDEICGNLCSDNLMNRLLEGDVGTGKTAVAFFAMYACAKSGHQSVMLAPTEILAKQHFENATKLFEKLGVKIAFLSSKTKTADRKIIVEDIKTGKIQILFGTHSVLSDSVEFLDLTLAITDEQHRFGVEQRGKLVKKNEKVDTLIMSATPIPRSLALVLYGDLNVTIIKEKPFVSSKRKTYLVNENKQKDMWQFVEMQMKQGSKVYVVCPTIFDDEMQSNNENIEKTYKKLIKNPYFEQNLAILHGKQKTEEQQQNLQQFACGNKKMLLATTIVEVGMDIKDANILVIENPEKFGLATLHQLRGRIARGKDDGYCFCTINKDLSEQSKERLSFFATHSDGFEIAEYDSKNRGVGNIFGTKQHGKQEIALNFQFDFTEFERAKEIYAKLVLSEENKEKLLYEAKQSYAEIIKKVVLN